MAKKSNSIPDEDTKWFKRGFQSKTEYVGWLHFNDLIDESFGYDDTYQDQYSGETVRISGNTRSTEEDHDESIQDQ